MLFFFNDTATTEIYTLSLHDALPISIRPATTSPWRPARRRGSTRVTARVDSCCSPARTWSGSGSRTARSEERAASRSEEHTSELQSRQYIVCRFLLEQKKISKSRSCV